MTIALLGGKASLERLVRIEGISVGLLSSGLATVPALQTYLDITQGNRVSEVLYRGGLPTGRLVRALPGSLPPSTWSLIRKRAADAPATIVPGALTAALKEAGVPARADSSAGTGALIAADRSGKVASIDARSCPARGCPGMLVTGANLGQLRRLTGALRGRDLLIAIERPPPSGRLLRIAVAGAGFIASRVTSDSTRTRGLVTATDIAPTILRRFGIEPPNEMNGEAIRAEGEIDLAGLAGFQRRLAETGPRRGPVTGDSILIWLVLTGIAGLAWRARGLRFALRLLGPTVAYLPLVLLLTGALAPSLTAERLLVLIVPPALAAATLALAPGWRALGVASLITVSAFAIDLVAGTGLIPRSLIGPNPAAGSRFYGIGNEIEATIGALLPIGLGALLASRPETRDGGRRAALAFALAGALAAIVFAAGRFGADVGAAIVLPAGAAGAAAVALGSRRAVVPILLAPLVGVVLLALIDLVAGGGAHLTRSLLQAGGFDQAADVLERRIRLAERSFERNANLPYLVLVGAFAGLGLWRRRQVRSWFRERAALAGFTGALAGTLIGTVSNDSGAVLLIIGCALAAVMAGYAWALRQHETAGAAPAVNRSVG